MKKILVVLLALTLVALPLWAACAPEEVAPPPEEEEEAPPAAPPKYVVVAGITALSGPAAPWGIAMDNVWSMLVDQINDAGGFTVNGQQYLWDLKMYDHEMDPSKALTAATRAVTLDKAVLILELDGGCIKASQEISEPNKVITFALAAPGKDMINPDNFYTFMYGIDSDCAALLYPWIAENTDIRKIAIFQPDTWTGDATANSSVWAIGQTDLEIVFDGRGDEAATDFYSPLTTILATNPDMLDVSNWDPATGALIIKQARELGFTGPLHIITPDIPTLEEVAGWENCEGAYLSPFLAEPNEVMKKFKADYIARYGEEMWPGPVGYAMYDYIFWMTEAIEGCQSFDGTEIAKYLATMTTTSIYGSPCLMGGEELYGIARIPLHPYFIAQVQGGEVVQVIDGLFPEVLR